MPGKRPRHSEAFLMENRLPCIMLCTIIQGSLKRFRPLEKSWNLSKPEVRQLIGKPLKTTHLPTYDEVPRPAVLRTARKPPELIHLQLQLVACTLKGS